MGAELTHILDSLGWAVLHSVWQGGVAFLLVIIWRALLRGRSPALRHAGQIMALFGCLIAFVWTFAIYIGLPSFAAESGATLSAANAAEVPRLLSGLISPFDPTTAQSGFGLSRITPILACLWALGFAAMSLRYAFAFGQVQQLRTLGIQKADAGWTKRFLKLAKQIGVTERVQLYVSPNVKGPMTLGLIKPVVLVPIGFLTGFPGDQVEAILRHELAHIRRHDYALNLLQAGVRTVLFYHPAIHIICRWADQDREQACDDLAVRQGRDPLTLARGLAALRLQAQPKLGLAATGSGKDMPLMNRLSRLAGQTPKRGRPEHILMSVLSALLLGTVYMGASARAEAHPVPPTVPDTVISFRTEAPIAPVPPVPPILSPMDYSMLTTGEAMQRFIDQDKAAYEDFAEQMKRYEMELEDYLENSNLNEDIREDYSEFYSDLAEDVSDMFEDRREAIEDLYHEQIERKTERKNQALERSAELQGLEAAMKGLKSAERKIKLEQKSAHNMAKLKAMSEARTEIERDIANIKMARAQAETAQSVTIAKEAQKRMAENAARQKENMERAKKLNAEARAHAKNKRAHIEIDRKSQKRHEEFRDVVMSELLKDGLIKSANETVFLSHPNGTMSLNGKAMSKTMRGKYCALLDSYGFTDNQSEITIKPDSLTILTDWKNGQHRTRVTYGSFESEKTPH